jgi:hypothetical protein
MAKPSPASPPPAAARPSTPAPPPASLNPPSSPQPGIAPGSVAARIHAHAEDAANQPQPVDIKREANKRKNEAITARLDAHRKGQVEGAEVATESEAPKEKPSSSKGASAESSSKANGTADRGSAESGTKTEPEASGETAEQTAERERRYDVKSIRDWARKHPEDAAEVAKQVFHVDGNLAAEWIRVQNKHRKRQTALDARDKELTERAAKQEAEAKDTIETLTPIASLFEAVNPDRGQEGGKFDPKKIDFDAADQAWHDLTGVPIDEYMRHRARKGVAINPEQRALKLENERLKKQLEKAAPEEAKDDTKPNGKAKEPAPELVGTKWESDIPEEHGLRQFAGWQKDLTKAMAPYHDEQMDEYSVDPETIADKLLLRKVKEFEVEEPEPEVKPKPKPPAARAPEPKPKPKAPASDDIIPADAYSYRKPAARTEPESEPAIPGDYAKRKRLALDRHNRRMRGELVDD